MRSLTLFFSLFLFTAFVHAATPTLDFIDRLQTKAGALNGETVQWMEKWRAFDLEQDHLYSFGEISGSTSVNIKVRERDYFDAKGYKSRGTFVPRNSSGNPNTEIAYFSLAALFGVDHLIRPAVRYELGPRASLSLQKLLRSTKITHPARKKNKARILAELESTGRLKGCLKAKKPDSAASVENISAVRAKIQAGSVQPRRGKLIVLRRGYPGDEYELARELSILMTFDVVFGQWDRFSGGNIGVRLDQNNRAHFYFTDNGGASLSSSLGRVLKTLRWFSRYDRSTIEKLRELHQFLSGQISFYEGYSNREDFIVALGLYFENTPQVYAERVKRNIGLLLNKVSETERRYGVAAYIN